MNNDERSQEDEPAPTGGIVVPVGDVPAMRDTILHALDQLGPDEPLHLISATRGESREAVEVARSLLSRAEGWALERRPEDLTLEAQVVSLPEGPEAYADQLASYAEARGARLVLLAPSVSPTGRDRVLQDLIGQLTDRGIETRIAPTPREQDHRSPTVPGKQATFSVLFFATLLFYLIIAELESLFSLLTGVAVAGAVTAIFHRVTFARSLPLPEAVLTAIRWVVYTPYLLWQIIKANLHVAYLILHPGLPLDPRLDRYRSSLRSDVARTSLANSITLTPGTLTVDVEGDIFYVHRLVPEASARELAVAVTFVFQGRKGLEREDPWQALATDEVIQP